MTPHPDDSGGAVVHRQCRLSRVIARLEIEGMPWPAALLGKLLIDGLEDEANGLLRAIGVPGLLGQRLMARGVMEHESHPELSASSCWSDWQQRRATPEYETACAGTPGSRPNVAGPPLR